MKIQSHVKAGQTVTGTLNTNTPPRSPEQKPDGVAVPILKGDVKPPSFS